MVRYHIHYAGDVQGVGFRYTACRVAEGFEVTGFVRNLADGRVECVVEGAPAQVEAFAAALADRMRDYIHRQTRQESPATGEFADFGVRR